VTLRNFHCLAHGEPNVYKRSYYFARACDGHSQGLLYLLALQKTAHLYDDLVRYLQRAVSSADRHLRTFTYLSFYVLYPLGVLIGILGQHHRDHHREG
jgi:hypothetical protein